MAARQSKRVTCVCQICGVEFSSYISAKRARLFCSMTCYGAARSKRTTPEIERFKRHVGVPDENGCIPWLGCVKEGEYGVFGSKTERLAHRFAYALKHGPIPDGLFVCHSCDNPICVNVDHLFLGTHQDNMDDMASKGRGVLSENHRWAKLTASQVVEIKRLLSDGHMQCSIATKFGVSNNAIHAIASGRSWKRVAAG